MIRAQRALAFFIAAVGLSASPRVFAKELLDFPFSDWAAEGAQSTVRLDSQCGLTISAVLTGSQAFNSVTIWVKNQSPLTKRMPTTSEVRFLFPDGAERIPLDDNQVRDVPPQKLAGYNYVFPTKWDFESIEAFDVLLPVEDIVEGKTQGDEKARCSVRIQFKRNSAMARHPGAYLDFSVISLSLAIGGSSSRAGLARDTSSLPASGYIDLQWAGMGLHNGYVIGFTLEQVLASVATLNVIAPSHVVNGNEAVESSSAYIGYRHRRFPGKQIEIGMSLSGSAYTTRYFDYKGNLELAKVSSVGLIARLDGTYNFRRLGAIQPRLGAYAQVGWLSSASLGPFTVGGLPVTFALTAGLGI